MAAMIKLSDTKILGKGVYGVSEGVRLLNFQRENTIYAKMVSQKTVSRWLTGYEYSAQGEMRHADPLWRPDFQNDDNQIEISFRDLIELRFVKTFRDIGLSLQTIRECFQRAVHETGNERPFSTQKFRTDGRVIFLEITNGVHEGQLIDLKRKQNVFRSIVAPSLHDLQFDAEEVSRWYPLGAHKPSIVIDPARAFGRPMVSDGSVPTETLAQAVIVEGSIEKVSRLYEVPISAVRDALTFEHKLAA
jgi:uncharacterized protein (DUF433 family)/DNA-binding transcriptional MerR regulator